MTDDVAGKEYVRRLFAFRNRGIRAFGAKSKNKLTHCDRETYNQSN
jgi:hypothetical protein